MTRCLIEIGDEYKYNFEAIDLLIRSQLVNLQQYDLFLAQHMENGVNYMAVGFAMQLVQRYCVDEKHNTPVTEVCLFCLNTHFISVVDYWIVSLRTKVDT